MAGESRTDEARGLVRTDEELVLRQNGNTFYIDDKVVEESLRQEFERTHGTRDPRTPR